MNKAAAEDQVSHLPDADMQAVPRALTRAAQRAREIAKQTGTELVVPDAVAETSSNDDE
ncbi:MAG: hypothetical protein ACJ74H_09415 [Thermoanaerobaculia bacterium]